MLSSTFRFAWGVVALLLVLTSMARASTFIDFNDPSLTGAYFAGDSFSQAGFLMTQQYDAGTVDTGAALGAVAPTNNTTQFYFNANDGDLLLSRSDGSAFSLDGFSVAFVPLAESRAPAQTIVIVAYATTMTGDVFGTYFGLGNTESTTGGSAFLSYADPLDFAPFTNLASVDFFACALTSSSVCAVATRNNGQFALDNVLVTAAAVPEPATFAMMVLGLLTLVLAGRRRR